MAAVFLTTLDNPYDYFTQFDEWYAFDTEKGYNTCDYLARISNTSTEMSEKEYEDAVEQAVNDACRLNITGLYKKVYEGESIKKKTWSDEDREETEEEVKRDLKEENDSVQENKEEENK